MRIAVCFNRVPGTLKRGEEKDRISEEGAEHEAEAVMQALQREGMMVRGIPLGESPADFMDALVQYAPHAVFNLCEGFWGDSHLEMNVAGLFPLLSLPVTGSPAFALGFTQDKALTKAYLAA
ncbi:hypothetical protein KKF84_00030, partial [Myxococcota bacterium]|nr:hypothetical protein [Myxococcota bacterium]